MDIFVLAHFNPRTREGCDAAVHIVTELTEKISIHAPVKGATSASGRWARAFFRFQSTHP